MHIVSMNGRRPSGATLPRVEDQFNLEHHVQPRSSPSWAWTSSSAVTPWRASSRFRTTTWSNIAITNSASYKRKKNTFYHIYSSGHCFQVDLEEGRNPVTFKLRTPLSCARSHTASSRYWSLTTSKFSLRLSCSLAVELHTHSHYQMRHCFHLRNQRFHLLRVLFHGGEQYIPELLKPFFAKAFLSFFFAAKLVQSSSFVFAVFMRRGTVLPLPRPLSRETNNILPCG